MACHLSWHPLLCLVWPTPLVHLLTSGSSLHWSLCGGLLPIPAPAPPGPSPLLALSSTFYRPCGDYSHGLLSPLGYRTSS